MPTSPNKKHGRDYLEEAVAKSTYHKKPLTRERAISCGILAIMLGTTGIHNFLMRQKKRGLLHLLFSSLAFGMFLIPLCFGLAAYRKHIDISSYDKTLNAILIGGIVLFAVSLIWAIAEGIILLINAKNFPDNEK